MKTDFVTISTLLIVTSNLVYNYYQQVINEVVLPIRIQFSNPQQALIQLKGVYPVEQWGRWSKGKTVTITLADNFPKRLKLSFTAHAFNANINHPINVQCGSIKTQITLQSESTQVYFSCHFKQRYKKIVFTIPQPISPQKLNFNTDNRNIGIGLETIEFISKN